jgi:hypothetical protein
VSAANRFREVAPPVPSLCYPSSDSLYLIGLDTNPGGLAVAAMALQRHETAPGLLYEADGESGRRYVITFDGESWTLDLFQHSEYEAEQQIDPQPAGTFEEAKRMAQDRETNSCQGC